jgi:cell division protein FtsI (penicillin-binding protein 3)
MNKRLTPLLTAPLSISPWRLYLVLGLMALLAVFLIVHVAGLQVLPNADKGFEFLQIQGESRTLRTETITAYRGVITDRNGEPLAVSTPVSTLWANPKVLLQSPQKFGELASLLGITKTDLVSRLNRYALKEFMYLQRQMAPDAAQKIIALDIPGVNQQTEYHRYYPAGEVAAHIVGMTDVDDRGQEGMELAYDAWLSGENGSKQVVKDLKGHTVKELQLNKAARSGQNLTLSIDLRLQYLAHRELKKAVENSHALAGSLVILDVETGELLAATNYPAYNPNDRAHARGPAMRNRALTDVYEPGSTVKPLAILAALESGKFKPTDVIDTTAGLVVGNKRVTDHQNYGVLDLSMVIAKSSNVAMSKIALQLDANIMAHMYSRLGIGQQIGTGFPGEAAGRVPSLKAGQLVERANVSYGYAMNTTVLQMVQAYSVIAAGGVKRPISLLRIDNPPEGQKVVDKKFTDEVKTMLTRVVAAEGTGTRARAISYSVAGKTGTAFKSIKGHYDYTKQISSFAGMAPVENPRIVAMVVIDEPQGIGTAANGGYVAAPAFSKIAEDALRMLQVPPDNSVLSTEVEKLAMINARKADQKNDDLLQQEELPL